MVWIWKRTHFISMQETALQLRYLSIKSYFVQKEVCKKKIK